MLAQHIPEKYAYGWFVKERGGIWDVYWHKGNLPGVTSYLSRRTGKDHCIILLANAEIPDIAEIENDIARVLKEKD